MKKNTLAIIFNILIVISGLIGIILSIVKGGIDFKYYTNLSNVFAIIISILFLIFNKKKSFIKDLRFISTSCLAVTFLVVLFILTPMYNFNYKLLMFTDVFFLFHTVCPLLSIISYICFEEKSNKVYMGFLFTLIYGIIMIVLNILNIVNGPYPFLMVYKQGIIMSIIWSVLIIGGSYVISILLNLLNTKIQKRS